jgi:hypothetical protein
VGIVLLILVDMMSQDIEGGDIAVVGIFIGLWQCDIGSRPEEYRSEIRPPTAA